MAIQDFICGDGCRIAYRFDGPASGPALMLSNSIATDLSMWDGEIAELARENRVLRYDTRGHGSSDAPVGAYSLDRLGRDVLELLDGLNIDRVHFCGLSLGGFVGQWLGVHAPERLDRLILSNTAPYLGPAQQWDELIAGLAARSDVGALADMFITNWFPKSLTETNGRLVGKFREMILRTPAQGLAGSFAVVRDSDLRRTLRTIETPTLVIGGEDDTVTLATHSVEIAAAIPNAELLLLPGVHLLNVEQHDAFVSAVMRFVGASDIRPRK